MSGKSLGDRAVQVALRCYPRWWRDRYGPDQEALVEDLMAEQSRRAWLAPGAWGLAGSFVVGALRARSTGYGMPAVPELWQQRARTAIIAASLAAALGASVALFLVGHTSQDSTSGSGSGATSGVIQLSGAGRVLYWEGLLLGVLSLVFIVQLAWVAVGLSGEMRSLAPRRKRVFVTAASLAPVVAIALGLLLLIAAAQLRPVISGGEGIGGRIIHVWYSYHGHPLAATILFGAGCTGILGGWFGGTVLLATMAARRRFPLQALMAGVRRARAMALIQGGVALCALALVITLPLQPPIGPDGGTIYRVDLGPWTPVLCAALVAGALITWAATCAAGRAVTRATSIA
jgi:hypothetical protein